MKLRALTVATLLALGSSGAMAGPVSWIDWTSPTAGTMTIGSSTVGVTLTATTPYAEVEGDGYYNNPATGFGATYLGLAPKDMIQVNAANTFTLTFSQAILNPYVALVSVGQIGLPITYTFNGPITFASPAGNNIWGTGFGYVSGPGQFTGHEYDGVLRLGGGYTSMTITTSPNEFWHGFNIGSDATIAPVPEPETYAMMLAGLGLLGLMSRRRTRRLNG